jgi:hypothetical protein
MTQAGNEARFNPDETYAAAVEQFRQAGLTAGGKLSAMSAVLYVALSERGAAADIARLQRSGFRHESILIASILMRFAPALDLGLKTMFGDAKQKKRKLKILREAAEIMGEADVQLAGLELGSEHDALKRFGFALPSTTAKALRFYAQMMTVREQALEALGANSGREIAMYTLAEAVHRSTGKFHDREVSGIIGAIENNPEYDETAHRVWRIRTCKRLNRTNVIFLPVLLHAANTVMNDQVSG